MEPESFKDTKLVDKAEARIAELTAQLHRLQATTAQIASQPPVNDRLYYSLLPTTLDSGITDHFGPPSRLLSDRRPSTTAVTVEDG